ncbi:MAG TPA: type II toxin-antitoxin system RelE/ParE family toxin [Phycisphaerales bacterium]|nr:type II toxin-antitoxin system RelE/ParE family toxin [Phycisphaerales bacterium]
MKPFILTPSAEQDVFGIADHLAAQTTDAAFIVLTKMEAALWRLGENPRIGRERPDLSPKRELRSWHVFDYLILYHPTTPIEVVRIVHGAQDLPTLLELPKRSAKKRS